MQAVCDLKGTCFQGFSERTSAVWHLSGSTCSPIQSKSGFLQPDSGCLQAACRLQAACKQPEIGLLAALSGLCPIHFEIMSFFNRVPRTCPKPPGPGGGGMVGNNEWGKKLYDIEVARPPRISFRAFSLFFPFPLP